MPVKANCIGRIKKAQFPGAGLTAAWLLIMETSKIIAPVVPKSLSACSAQQKMQPSEASTCPVLKEMSAVTDGKMPPNSECLFQWGCVFLIICCPYLKRFVPALYKCTSGCSLKIPSRAVSHGRRLIRWKGLWKGTPCFTSTQGRSSSRTCTDLINWLSAWGQPLSDQVLLVALLSPWHSLSPGRQQPTPAVSVQLQSQQFSSSRNKAGALNGTSISTTAAQLCSSLAGAEQAGARGEAAKALIALDPDGKQQQPGAPCSCREEQLQRRDCSDCCRTGMGSSQPLAAAFGRAPAAFQGLAWGHGCSLSAHLLIAWLGGRGEV
ncbi:uncharacterized protein ACIQIH_004201 isoform 2-T6 [Cyanocitta cristata]